ncbi:MAG TPA: heme-binding protein [Candidatus Bathyarchaeia archaeon]|nr:heme-binding protein [Candidatus Bathyarchaeia archaeon]
MDRLAHRNPANYLLWRFGIAAALCGGLTGCGGGSGGGSIAAPPPPPPAPQVLTQSDVTAVVQAAATAAQSDAMVISVVDRMGNILAVYQEPSAPALSTGNFGNQVATADLAVALARTGAFFSNDQAPLSSRTVRYISGIHFPPGVANAPNAALYGIENTNRGCTLSPGLAITVPPATTIAGTSPGLGIITGKADTMDSDPTAVNPGGVPIFKNGQVVGGVGVAGVPGDVAEYAAFTAATVGTDGITIPSFPAPGEVVIDGIALPFVDQTTAPAGITAGTYNAALYTVGPIASPGPDPSGDLIPPTAGPIGGLTAAQVAQIVDNAVATANQTRALIRLPLGSRTRMTIAVSDLDGTIIALHRMDDGTVFSIDVAATKARNVIYFSGPTRQPQDLNDVPIGTAVTNRTIGFGAQPLFPPGINGTSPGPFFNIYLQDVANPCTQGFQVPGPSWPKVNQSGIVFFPGSEPLYINGNLVGGLGVSGDGVDQDDYVTAGGAAGFEPDPSIRADQIVIDNVRLPYLKFPRNPTQ